MELTAPYIVSQFFVIINYAFLIATYQLKSRKGILICNFAAIIASAISYILLSAWSGLAANIIAVIRNIIFISDERKNGKSDKITKKDIIVLIILYVISLISGAVTYDGLLSLMSVFATMIYTYSVWQKKPSIYKVLGIPVSILWITYNIYVASIFGIILEILLLVAAIIGIVRDNKKEEVKEDNI